MCLKKTEVNTSIKKWIKGNYSKEALDYVSSIAEDVRSLSNSQIRKLYEVVIKAESKLKLNKDNEEEAYKEAYKQLIKLKVLLAYSLGRAKKEQKSLWKKLKNFVEGALCLLPDNNDLKNSENTDNSSNIEKILAFRDLMEALVAYHREKSKK